MERWMWARQAVVGRPEDLTRELVEGLPELLQAATDGRPTAPSGDGSFEILLRTGTEERRPAKYVRARVGEQEAGAGWVSVPLEWAASPGENLFPAFTGRVEIEPTSNITADIMLIGQYRPPLGPIGQVLDATLFNNTAEHTAQWLVRRLAAALIDRVHGFDEDVRHPAGQLTVRSIMTPDPVTFTADQPLRAAAGVLLSKRISGAPVVDSAGRVIGMLSEGDLLDKVALPPSGRGREASRAVARHRGLVVGDVCTRPARTTEADTMVRNAAGEMSVHDVDRLVVLDGGVHVGILTRTDALKALVRDADDLEMAVYDVIAQVDAPDVRVAVSDGVVHVAGGIQLRSDARALLMGLEAVDGVVAVSADDLTWREDDMMSRPIPLI